MMFIILLISINVFEGLVCINVCGCDNVGYLLRIENVDGWKFDILYLKKPVLWLIDKIKELFGK